MNFNRSRPWPHPVLSPLGDDIAPNAFDFRLDVWPEHQRWLLGVEVPDSDATLHRHIRSGKAHYLLHVECKRTYFRQAFTSLQPKFEIPISGDLLFGLVEVSLLVIAAKDIDKYRHPGQHADYGTNTFDVNPGEPLAVAQSQSFEAFLEADPILKLSSIIDIKKGEEYLRVMKVNCFGDRIVIELPPPEYLHYRAMRDDLAIRGLLATTVILPALLDGLFFLRTPGLDLDEFKAAHRWSRCVLGRLDRMEIDVTHANAESSICLQAAQALLREPLRRSLEDLSGLFSGPQP